MGVGQESEGGMVSNAASVAEYRGRELENFETNFNKQLVVYREKAPSL